MPTWRHLVMVTAVPALFIGAGAAGAETRHITIDKMAFSPPEIEAKVGDTIEWTNNDAFTHTATAKGGFDIMMPPKKSGIMVAKSARTIDYYCRLHPNMKGRINIAP